MHFQCFLVCVCFIFCLIPNLSGHLQPDKTRSTFTYQIIERLKGSDCCYNLFWVVCIYLKKLQELLKERSFNCELLQQSLRVRITKNNTMLT